MTFPRTRTESTLPVFLIVAFFALHPLHAQTDGLSGGAVFVGKTILMNSSAVIDSFDSTDESKSTNGLYDPDKRQSNGNIFINLNTKSDLRNAFVYGDLNYSGPAVKNTSNVQGVITTPWNGTTSPVNDPTWPDGSFVQFIGGGSPPNGGGVLVDGTVTNPTQVKVIGDFTVSGGKLFSIVPDTFVDRYLTVWVTGKFTTSGSGRLDQSPFVHVTWIVDKDIATSGDNYENESGKPANVSLLAVGTGKVNITGSTSLTASINGPLRNVNISGTGGLTGDVNSSTLVLGDDSAVHVDEALAPGATFRISCEGQPWGTSYGVNEYVESGIQFTGQPNLAHNGGGISNYPDNGTGYLQGAYRLAFLDLQGRALTLKAVDLAEYSTVYAYPDTVTFVGTKVDGSTVSQTFVTDGACDGLGGMPDFETFTFGEEWSDLVRIDVQGDYGFSIDNIILAR
jgi:hypothetical protein